MLKYCNNCVIFLFYKNFKNIKSITPGMPNIPVITAVPTFNPIWNPQILPIAFITNIRIPPSIEFPISLAILLNGKTRNLPIKNKNIIHAIYTITLFNSITITFSFFIYFYDCYWTNITTLPDYILFLLALAYSKSFRFLLASFNK